MLSSKLFAPLAAGSAAGALALQAYNSQKASPTAQLTARHSSVSAASAGVAPFGNPAHTWDYYQKCMIGGILSCGLTHTFIVPLDVVKCRMQVGAARAPCRWVEMTQQQQSAPDLSLLWTYFLGTSLLGCCWR